MPRFACTDNARSSWFSVGGVIAMMFVLGCAGEALAQGVGNSAVTGTVAERRRRPRRHRHADRNRHRRHFHQYPMKPESSGLRRYRPGNTP